MATLQVLEAPSPIIAWWDYWTSFERALRGQRASRHTLRTYRETAEQFVRWSEQRGLATEPQRVLRQQVHDFMAWLAENRSPATSRVRFSSLRRFFNWLVDEGELEHSPMERMQGPKVPVAPPAVLRDEELRALLQACEGKDFWARRDQALIRLMDDTGMRRGGVCSMTVERLDLDHGIVRYSAKGGDEAIAPISDPVAAAIDRYLRARQLHPLAQSCEVEVLVADKRDRQHPLWLASSGPLTGDGLYQMLERRAQQAGLGRKIWPHLFRHTFGHNAKSAGISDEDLMALGHWSDLKMVQRYGASAKMERALATHRKLALADRL
jgi:site-specific recombinase XerD